MTQWWSDTDGESQILG